MMNAESEDYAIIFSEDTATLTCSGSFRMHISDFVPIQEVIMHATEKLDSHLELDIREVSVLNSAGINIFSRLVINLRKKKDFSLLIKVSQNVPWHAKLIKNLQRLMPDLLVETY